MTEQIPLDSELKQLLLEARDTVQASTAEDNISSERKLYRMELYIRLVEFCKKHNIKHGG